MKRVLLTTTVLIGLLLEGCTPKPTTLQLCNLGKATSCTNLGNSYGKDFAKSSSAYDRACELGDTNGCIKLVQAYRDGKHGKNNISKASYYAKKACKQGSKYACKMRVRPKTAEEIAEEEAKTKKFVACFRKIESCKRKCLDNYNPNQSGGVLAVAQHNLEANLCMEKCRAMQCF